MYFHLRIVNSILESGQHFIFRCIAQNVGSTVKSMSVTMSGKYLRVNYFHKDLRLVELIVSVQ